MTSLDVLNNKKLSQQFSQQLSQLSKQLNLSQQCHTIVTANKKLSQQFSLNTTKKYSSEHNAIVCLYNTVFRWLM